MGFINTFFGGGRPSQQYYDKGISTNLRYLGDKFQGDDSSMQSALAAFNQSNPETISRVRAAADQANSDLGNLYTQNQNYDPMATYERLRSGNLGALKDWSGQIEGQGSRGDQLALAAMGMGGRPGGSYSSILRADRISRNIAPVLGNIMSSLGSDTSTIGNQRSQNLGNLSSLIGQRLQLPTMGYGMELDPANALLALRGGQIGNLGGMADVAKSNNAGWYQKPGAVDYWDRGMQSLSRTASTAGQWASLIGGMGGMGGGGGGGGGNAFQGFSMGGMQPSQTSSNAFGSYAAMPNGQMAMMRSPQQQQSYDYFSNYYQ